MSRMSQPERPAPGLAPPLGDMNGEDFRRYGHQLVDWIADYYARLEARPVLAQIQPGDLIKQLPATPPEHGEPMDEILADVDALIVPALTNWHHPSFFAYFATSTSAPGIFGEMLSAAFDVKALNWRAAPAATELEEGTLRWLRQMLDLPESFGGIIYDTASVATMHAFAAARESLDLHIREDGMSGRPDLPLLRVYASEHAHSVVDKAAITLGLGQRAVCKIPADAEYRMDADALNRAIAADKQHGFVPCAVAATVGTTSTSSVDPVSAIADICAQHNVWLHVDAAYAGSAAIVPELRHLFAGCERADSFTLNPHKWLFTPFDLSVLYCRHMDMLRRAFSLVIEILLTPEAERETVINHSEYGIQLGRRFRALKLWFILRYFGREGLAARIREHCRLAQLFASWIDAAPVWERLAPVPFSLVCFRASPPSTHESDDERAARLDALNEQLMHDVNATGAAFLSHTKLHDRFTLRLAIGNINTTEAHVRRVWELLNEHLARLTSS
jgi:aromatic-L-amino-acid/L-tryptophan decarboxylase